MLHISKTNNIRYQISKCVCPDTGKNHDITIIFDFVSSEYVILVGWYFGEYDFEVTEDYIKNGKDGVNMSTKTVEIFWDDLTEAAQEKLRKAGLYHENIDLSPLAILEQEEPEAI